MNNQTVSALPMSHALIQSTEKFDGVVTEDLADHLIETGQFFYDRVTNSISFRTPSWKIFKLGIIPTGSASKITVTVKDPEGLNGRYGKI